MTFTCKKCGAIENDHEVTHSKVIDKCVDNGIIKEVEFINREICPTMFSCEGDERVASVSIKINNWPVFEKWLTDRDYTIGYASDFYYEEDGWGIKIPKDTDFGVWHVQKTLMTHITFNVDYKKVFV